MAETKYFDVVVSPEDHAEYRGFVLPNGLRVLLLSDKRVTQVRKSCYNSISNER